MQRTGFTVMFVCWIAVLCVEAVFLYRMLRSGDENGVLFHIVIIFITLVVGAVGLLVSALNARDKDHHNRFKF